MMRSRLPEEVTMRGPSSNRNHKARFGKPGRARVLVALALFAAPSSFAAVAAAAPAAADDAQRRQEHRVAMRDGVRLATDVYLPEGDGPFPAVLQRTPYNKLGVTSAGEYNARGYALVVQDQRGRYRSEGEYRPHENELHDGYDTVEWIAAQPWSDGKVGVSGASAVGIAANLAAAANPPHLVAAYVVVAPESLWEESRFIGGVFKEADTGNWMRGQGVAESEVNALRSRVLLDSRWQEKDFIFLRDQVDVPIYNVGGWYDLFLKGTINNFRYLQDWGAPGARGRQKVWIGPIGHGALSGDLAYPGGGDRADKTEELRWFDHWLRGIDNGIAGEPPVAYYMMSAARRGAEPSPANRWLRAETWPPPGSRAVRLYLAEGGALSWDEPRSAASRTSYRFDPAQPVPTVGGLNLTIARGPMDQREIPDRPDYLRFQSSPLDRELVLAGALSAELWVATDGPDTDFAVKLVDVYPDGYEAIVIDSIQRVRYRGGRRAEDVAPATPGEPIRLEVDLWHTAVTFERGHRIAVHVTSSNHPRFEVNPNNGAAPGDTRTPSRVATNTVFHEQRRASAVVLPVMDDTEPRLPAVASRP
jgi:predicted acyl esterase